MNDDLVLTRVHVVIPGCNYLVKFQNNFFVGYSDVSDGYTYPGTKGKILFYQPGYNQGFVWADEVETYALPDNAYSKYIARPDKV